jgi:hypothetical protein
MLIAVLLAAYVLALFHVYGLGTLALLRKILQFTAPESTSFPIIFLLGMLSVTTLESLLSLIMPLAAVAALLTLLGAAAIAIVLKPWRGLRAPDYVPAVWLLVAVMALVILEAGTHRPTDYDTALYHAQTIHWIESFRAVPGLANIHLRLAYNSAWLPLVAAFSFAFLGGPSLHLLNALMTAVALAYFAGGVQGLLKGEFKVSNLLKAVLVLLPLYLYASDLSAPNTDLPVILLIWVTTALTVEKLETSGPGFDVKSASLVLLVMLAVVLKLSALPLGLLPALVLAQGIQARAWRRLLMLSAAGLIILLPWMLRSIVQSGYLVFPFSQIDLFTFDWKYPPASVTEARQGILWFNRFPVQNWRDYMHLGTAQWVALWFENLDPGQKILVSLAALSPAGLLAAIFGGAFRAAARQVGIVFVMNYLGVYFWLLSAPVFRFGYGYLLGAILLALTPSVFGLASLEPRLSRAVVPVGLASLAILLHLYLLSTTLDPRSIGKRLLLPADYPSSHAHPCPLDGSAMYCADQGGLCSYSAFPCIPIPKTDVVLRGGSLQDGFRTVTNP